MATSRILGRDRMRKVLKALPGAVRKQLRTAILASAEDIAATQRTLAPVRTGALRDSIKVTPGDEDLPAYAAFKSRQTVKDPELSAIITAGNKKVRYAHLQEFGTVNSRAQPFFYPGFRARRKPAQARINRAARNGIKDGLK